MTTSSGPPNTRQQAVGAIGFWLFVPIGVSFLISVLIRSFVSERFSLVGTAALIYAVFSLFMLTKMPNKVVQTALLIVNFGMILIWGYFQWQELAPKTWPVWTQWIGVALAGILWLAIAFVAISRLGKKAMSQRGGANGHTVHSSAPEPHLSADITEKVIAALKLAGKDGDVTVNTGKIIEQLGLQAVANHHEAAAKLADSIMRAVQQGFYKDEDMPQVRAMIRRLHDVPDAPEAEEQHSSHERKPRPPRTKVKTIEWD